MSDHCPSATERYRRRGPEWEREGGEGPPPDPNMRRKLDSDEELVTHLFTCVNCGRRLASPPGPPSDMICGNCGGDYVCHTFDPAEYARIRWYSDPRKEDEECNVQADIDRSSGVDILPALNARIPPLGVWLPTHGGNLRVRAHFFGTFMRAW